MLANTEGLANCRLDVLGVTRLTDRDNSLDGLAEFLHHHLLDDILGGRDAFLVGPVDLVGQAFFHLDRINQSRLHRQGHVQIPQSLVYVTGCKFAPSPTHVSLGKSRTTPPSQALALSNSEAFHLVADLFAGQLVVELLDDVRRDKEDDLFSLGFIGGAAPHRAEVRNVAENRNLRPAVLGQFAEQAANHDGMAVLYENVRGNFSGCLLRQGRRANQRDATGRIFRVDLHADVAVLGNEGSHNQLRAGFKELDVLRCDRLGDGRRIVTFTIADHDFAALLVHHQQFRVGQNGRIGDRLQCTNEQRYVR